MIFLFLMTMLGVTPFSFAIQELYTQEDLNNFLLEKADLHIIQFYDPRCSDCKEIESEVEGLQKRFYGVLIARINRNTEELKAVKDSLGVKSVPAFFYHTGPAVNLSSQLVQQIVQYLNTNNSTNSNYTLTKYKP